MLPGKSFDHYFQLLLPALVLPAGILAAQLASASVSSRSRVWLFRLTPTLVAIGLVVLQLHWFIASPRDRAAALHPAGFFLNVVDDGAAIKSLLRDDESMYAWCDEPELYLLAGKRPPAAGLWKMHTIDGPVASWLTKRTLDDLNRAAP